MKKIELLSYDYPNTICVLIGGVRYTFESSEFFCRRFLRSWELGGRFNAFNWFRSNANLISKEVANAPGRLQRG